MNVLITGGNGFLGSHLTKFLVQKNYNVLVISRKCDCLVDVLDKITFIQQKATYKEYKENIESFSPNYVIHFAWDGGNSYSNVNNLSQFSINIPNSIELLEIIKNIPSKPMFIGVGSFAEYGILKEKARESQIECPTTFYGMSKLMFKTISQKFCSMNNIPWAWIRPCYVYGNNDVSTRLIPSTIHSLLENKEIKLDTCDVTIDYLHVSDFTEATFQIIKTKSSGVFNICSGIEYKLKNILENIESQTKTKGKIIFDSSLDRENLSKYICGDNSAIRNLGWVPNVDIDIGIQDIIRKIRMDIFMKSNPVDYDGLCDANLY